MNEMAKKGMILLVALGLIISVSPVCSPVGAAAGRAPKFVANVIFTDYLGGHGNSSLVNKPVNITANVSIAPGQPAATSVNVSLSIDGSPEIALNLGAIGIGEFKECSWDWTPDNYGDHTLDVIAINGTDTATQTRATLYFRSLASNITIDSVALNAASALVGVDRVNITARLVNNGNSDGTANVSYMLDGTGLLGHVEQTVMAGGPADAVLQTSFADLAIADGNHTVIVAMNDFWASSKVSGNITLKNPVPEVEITDTEVTPGTIEVAKGATVPVNITVTLNNEGDAPDANFTVEIYDGTNLLSTLEVNDTIAPRGSLSITHTWVVDDRVQTGLHTLRFGLKGRLTAITDTLTINGVADISVDTLTVEPASDFQGSTVRFTATLFNNGTETANDVSVEFWDGNTSLGTSHPINVTKGGTAEVGFNWTLPVVTANTSKTIIAKVPGAQNAVNVTIKVKAPKIEILDFSIPDTIRIGDRPQPIFQAIIKNTGTGEAFMMTVDFYDNQTKLNGSQPFTLTVGSTKEVSVMVNISGDPDVNHTFYVRALDAEKGLSQLVGHQLRPASVVLQTFKVSPGRKDKQPKDSTQTFVLTVNLQNIGEMKSTDCTLKITEGGNTLYTVPIVLGPGEFFNKTYDWSVSGAGDHKAVATLTGLDAGTAEPKMAQCTLEYTPGFEALLLVAAILVALLLVRRRKN